MGAPAVTLYYLSGHSWPAVQRANILLVLWAQIMMVIAALAFDGRITLNTLLLSGALYLPYAGARLGSARASSGALPGTLIGASA